MTDCPKKILIVDDNELVRFGLTQMLSRLGYEVVAADNGEKGLDLFLKNRFDLVITDFEMPGMNGIDLVGHIKQRSPITPVILMTGMEKEATLVRINGSPFDQALFKPFGIQEIEEKIQSAHNRF